jgi:hypothetical protein
MKSDFTRDTFNPVHQFTRVLMQQGRVQLDADSNEQVAIFWHYLRALAADLIGPHGGPANDFGFAIEAVEDGPSFTVGPGRYYVNGMLCENRETVRYVNSSHCIFPGEVVLEEGRRYLVYLDVWERHLNHIEAPSIREVALGGPDTASRAQVVWQVRPLLLEEDGGNGDSEARLREELEMLLGRLEAAQANGDEATVRELSQRIAEIRAALRALENGGAACGARLRALLPATSARLQARARVAQKPEDPCTIPPQASYRGAENQLYRVEIHRPGADRATFKWSRDNGSVVFPILTVSGQTVSLAHLGRDGRFTLKEGDWVEAIDDDYTLEGRPSDLLRVEKVFREEQKVLLSAAPHKVGQDLSRHPFLRRWDQPGTENAGGALPVQEGDWLALEDGVQIRFGEGGDYRSGDYWLIPARTATGDVEWPLDAEGRPVARSPHGTPHYYAPLAIITFGDEVEVEDCRCVIEPLARCGEAGREHLEE